MFALRRRYRTVAQTDFYKNSTFAGPCRRLGVLGVPGCRRLLVLLPVFPGNTKTTTVKAAASGEPDPPNQKDVSINLRVAFFFEIRSGRAAKTRPEVTPNMRPSYSSDHK